MRHQPQGSAYHRSMVFYAVMVCLLLPICVVAILGTQNERPTRLFYWHALTGEQPFLIAFENGPTRAKLYCIDLKKGSMTTRSIRRVNSRLSVSNFNTQVWAYTFKREERRALQMVEMQSSNSAQTREIQLTVQENWESLCIVDNHIIRQRSGRLESTDFRSGTNSDSILCPITGSLRLEHIKDTKSFLVSESRFPGNLAVKQQFLFEVTGGMLRQTSSWREIDHYQFRVAFQPYIVSLLDDGISVEVRNATSGDVVSSYLIPQVPTLATPMTSIDTMSYGKSWIHWRSDPLLYTDARTGKSLPVPAGSTLIERDLDGNRLITMSMTGKDSSGWDCVVVDGTTGEELSRFDVAPGLNCPFRHVNFGVFMTDTNQMVYATQDCRFFIYDLSSGKLIRSFDPLFWVDWNNRLAAIAYGVWCIVWLRVSAKLHPYGWADLAICSGLAVAFCFYQLQNNTDPRYSILVLCGIFGSWVLAAVTWLVFGKSRWSLRVQPLLLLIGITTGIIALATDRDRGVLAPFVVGLSLLVIAYLFALLPLRYLRLRFQNEAVSDDRLEKTIHHHSSAFALRDLFLLTMVFALLFAVARWLPAADWSQASQWLYISILVGFLAIPNLFAFWTAIGRSTWIARWGFWIIVIVGNETLSRNITMHTVPWDLTLSTVIATLFCFYAYRLRGWRLQK